ncbi:MAG TPA: TetR/AcrR family transcriptional regulator [Acidimicrobiales bacterium]|nr:TetR/AcrR family transcriptional regulator [Acidimicrobiales bacterium]
MPRGKAKPSSTETAAEREDEEIPEWKRQSVERSLTAARARAQQRSDRFVATTIELMGEKGSLDFTVQDVVDRSHMSIRTFYNYFASKDDLLAAVYQTIVSREVTPRLRTACERQTDPVLRIRAYIEELYELTSTPSPVAYSLTTFHNRLAEIRPADLDHAFRPQVDLIIELVRDAMAAKRLRSPLEPEKVARLLHHTVLAIVHTRVLGADPKAAVTAEELWLFCAHGIGVQGESGEKA